MKRIGHLYPELCSFENLLLASRRARLGKRQKPCVADFEFMLEHELIRLQHELSTQSYRPGSYREFTILEPKVRKISAAPYRDRVVHHAVCQIIEPIFEKAFIFDSYANRKNKGTHGAILRFQEFARQNKYALKCDIRKFFPSIDLGILKTLIRKKIKCPDTLWLIDLILDNSNPQEKVLDYFPGDDLLSPCDHRIGLPIGNLTSQFFANIYLNGLDHFVKQELRRSGYVRYVDDFVLFSDSKDVLLSDFNKIATFLNTLRLRMHPGKSMIYQTGDGVHFLGHKVFPDFRRLNRKNVVLARRRYKRLKNQLFNGKIEYEALKKSVEGWLAHAAFSNTYRLRQKVKEDFLL